MLANTMIALPELILAVGAMVLLMVGVFRGRDSAGLLTGGAVALFAVCGALLLVDPPAAAVAFNGQFVVSAYTTFAKLLTLLGAAIALVMINSWSRTEGVARFEIPVVVVFATLGMLMMISANDFIALYVGLELQSLSLYVLAAFHRANLRATEAGVKYFVLGALASGLLLYGASLVYGFAGTTAFDGLAAAMASANQESVGVIIGIVFVISGLAFKVSAVPFHMWTPDVYEGAPTPVTAFFSVAPKIAALALFLRVLAGPFAPLIEQWQQVVILISALSMAWGAIAAINQNNIKRLMAYSSIGHVGYALIGLAVGTTEGARGVLFYLFIYLFMNLGTFACILAMRVKGRAVEAVSDLSGIARTNPGIALALGVLMFSMAGIPPMAGFLAKFYVFMAAVNAGLIPLAVFGLIASAIAAYYYLRIIKVMYFDAAGDALDKPDLSTRLIIAACSIVMLVYFVLPAGLVGGAETAARALSLG
ncbi:MAG: NADH-quinone oxidoreductase subunit NuoN [Rhodospirillaceae bacterium]|nr:NADH-quinone oxidoreductase subunit NuoN [Rhodospirillaceae bacterium]